MGKSTTSRVPSLLKVGMFPFLPFFFFFKKKKKQQQQKGFNGADLRNVCTEAGMFAIRAGRGFTTNDDFMKGVRKLLDAKKLEQNKIDTSNFQGTKG